MFNLKVKAVFVTGGDAGIGAATCSAMSEQGASVWIADRDIDAANRLANEIRSTFCSATAIEMDVTDSEACLFVANRVGDLDILINNAGVGCVDSIVETSDADFDRMCDCVYDTEAIVEKLNR